jgi:hypothetical protein
MAGAVAAAAAPLLTTGLPTTAPQATQNLADESSTLPQLVQFIYRLLFQ